jgi:hypothetical protein
VPRPAIGGSEGYQTWRRREEDSGERGGKGAASVAFCERQERRGRLLSDCGAADANELGLSGGGRESTVDYIQAPLQRSDPTVGLDRPPPHPLAAIQRSAHRASNETAQLAVSCLG